MTILKSDLSININNRKETVPNYIDKAIKEILNFFYEMEFFAKIAICCAIVQQLFYWVLNHFHLNFVTNVLIYWLVGSVSFYSISLFIEKVIKNNDDLRKKFNARVKQVKKTPFPAFTVKGIILGEIKSLITVIIILYLVPEVHRGNSLLLNFGWFFMRIAMADFFFYFAHRLFHTKPLRKLHLKHHAFRDTSGFVAGHKGLIEYIVVTITDLVPVLIFGYDLSQLCAWTVIVNAYNIEGHSSLSIFFIPSDFHDLHHTCFNGNYGIHGLWDKVFNTLNTPTKKPSIMFPMSCLIEKYTSTANVGNNSTANVGNN